VVDIPYEEYKSMHKFTPEPNHEIEDVLFVESNTIQLEMLIYLKIWEGETFLKKFYQLSRLINGQDYDWHLNISYGKKIFGSMERSEIIKQLKENLQKKFPDLFEIINRIHKSQIRNAIAHSQYAMVGRTIMLNNQRKDKLNSISSLKFDEWVEIFHDTITIYTLYEIFFEKVKEYYFELSKEFRLKREVRVNRYYPEPNKYLILLYTREHFKDWSPHTHT
jgi:hypothetical protein